MIKILQEIRISDIYLDHVAWWEPNNMHALGHVSSVGSVYYTGPAQHLRTVGYTVRSKLSRS